MAFVKYSKAKLNLVGEDIPDWVDEEEVKVVEASVEDSDNSEENKDKKDG